MAASSPPFLGWKEANATSLAAIKPGNFVRYRNLTGASRSVTLQSVDNDAVGIHGIQIINSGADTDGDGMSDALEVEHRLEPAVSDATADADADGMSNAAEIAAGTDPHNRDTDRDGIADGAEAAHGTSPLNPDSDGDTLVDGEELNPAYFTSFPNDADSDDDGFSDSAERTYGSDPKSAASMPPPVPVWNAGTRTWLWRIDNVRTLWNHEQSMLGAIEGDDAMLFEAVADINQSGWTRQIGMGIRYINGKLVHRFRAIEGAFHRNGSPAAGFWDSDWNATPTDRTRAYGFSGYGAADDSLPLRLEFSATQPNVGTNLWTLNFRIFNLTNPAAPVTLASYTDNTAVAADASLLSGTTVWKNQSGTTGRVDIWKETGVRVAITPNPLGPVDSDNDGMPDTWETTYLFNPASLADAAQDFDLDGLSNLREFLAGTHPRNADSDGDGVPDGVELDRGFDPLSAASVPTWFHFTGNIDDLDRFVFGNNITTPFARNAIGGQDQLRQRVAFALSQILVVSRRDANLEEKPEAMTNYYDTLVRHALGNYGDLLREVTFHPSMGWYLSHAGNQKADPSIPRYPDENYAREIMQLFTIGLWELHPDGSRKLTPAGDPIPTYDNGDVTELARVFTGLYFASPYGWGGGGWADDHFTLPMVMYPERHDFEAKRLPNGVVIPAREVSETHATQDVRDAVEALFRHPNTPPFVCRQLIQFLVTDNPTPGYIQRAQDVFVNDGSGVRGNLAAVVKAILLDPEARNLPLSPSYGKVREPVIRTMHLGRIFNLPQAHPKFVWWNWTENFYGPSIQEPMNSPSVFNFYTPVYQAPGEIRNAGLVSPGFQIINTYSAVSFPNLLWDYLHDGFKAAYDHQFPLDYSDTLLLAENPAALVDHVDLLVCAGSMTARTRGILLAALQNPALSQKDRVALAVWTAMTSPEGVVQK